MRRLILLAVVIFVLIGTGIVTVSRNDSGTTIKFNRDKAKEGAEKLVREARNLRQGVKERRQEGRPGER